MRLRKDRDVVEQKYPENREDEKFEFGKLGQFGLFFNVGNGSDTITSSAGSIKKVGGLLVGIDFKGSGEFCLASVSHATRK